MRYKREEYKLTLTVDEYGNFSISIIGKDDIMKDTIIGQLSHKRKCKKNAKELGRTILKKTQLIKDQIDKEKHFTEWHKNISIMRG